MTDLARSTWSRVSHQGLQASFDDLYSATYRILDDAKADHDLVKQYKGSHGSPDPHPRVADFGEFFFRTRLGLLAYAASAVNPSGPAALADLDAFDNWHSPRVRTRIAFDLLAEAVRCPGQSAADVFAYITTRTHQLGAYRGGSSGYDDEARAFAAAHFREAGMGTRPDEVLVFCGGAKGAFMAFCAALMCRRRHDDLRHLGGLMLAPAGYYQSLRLIPSVFGGEIHVTSELTGETVSRWLAETADHSRRCVYVPLVNNVDGWVLTDARARSIARAVLKHNAARRSRPVYVLADDVYAGSYLSPDCEGVPIAVMSGADVGDPALGRMSDWTLSVITASKTFALPTARVAFATSTNPALLSAVGHYRTVLSQGRVPQVTELTAAAALSFTPQSWIDAWNSRYRAALADLTARISAINAEAGLAAYQVGAPEGGWHLPLRVAPSLMPGAASSVDAFAVLLHYGAEARDTGIAMLPGGLFGYPNDDDGFVLRGTLAVPADDLCSFAGRLRDAVVRLTGPGGPELVAQAMKRARGVADVDAILASCRY